MQNGKWYKYWLLVDNSLDTDVHTKNLDTVMSHHEKPETNFLLVSFIFIFRWFCVLALLIHCTYQYCIQE